MNHLKSKNVLESLSLWMIKNIHKRLISPWLNKKGVYCRFYPSCSNYGILAIEKYGFFRGWYKTILRVKKCVPDNYDSSVDFP